MGLDNYDDESEFFDFNDNSNTDQNNNGNQNQLNSRNDSCMSGLSNKISSGVAPPPILEPIPPPPSPIADIGRNSRLAEFSNGLTKNASKNSSVDIPLPPPGLIPSPPSPPVPKEPIPPPPTPPRIGQTFKNPDNFINHAELIRSMQSMPNLQAFLAEAGKRNPPKPPATVEVESRKNFQQHMPPPRLLSGTEIPLMVNTEQQFRIKSEPIEKGEKIAPPLDKINIPPPPPAIRCDLMSPSFDGICLFQRASTSLACQENILHEVNTQEDMEICTTPMHSEQTNRHEVMNGQLLEHEDEEGSLNPTQSDKPDTSLQNNTHTINLKDPREKLVPTTHPDLDGNLVENTPTESTVSESAPSETMLSEKTIEEYKAEIGKLTYQVCELAAKREWWKQECEKARHYDLSNRDCFRREATRLEQAKTLLHQENDELKMKINLSNKKLEENDKTIRNYMQEMIEKDAHASTKDHEIERLKMHTAEQTKNIGMKINKITNLESKIKEYENSIKEAEKIERIKNQMNEMRFQFEKKEKELRVQQESSSRALLEIEKKLKAEFEKKEATIKKEYEEKFKSLTVKKGVEKKIQTDVTELEDGKKTVTMGLQTDITLEKMANIFDETLDSEHSETEMNSINVSDLRVLNDKVKILLSKNENSEKIINILTNEHQILSKKYEKLIKHYQKVVELMLKKKCLSCVTKPLSAEIGVETNRIDQVENGAESDRIKHSQAIDTNQFHLGETSGSSCGKENSIEASVGSKKRLLEDENNSENSSSNSQAAESPGTLKKPKSELVLDDDIILVLEPSRPKTRVQIKQSRLRTRLQKIKEEESTSCSKSNATVTCYVNPIQSTSLPTTPATTATSISLPQSHPMSPTARFPEHIPMPVAAGNLPSTSNYVSNEQTFGLQPSAYYHANPTQNMNPANQRLQHLHFRQSNIEQSQRTPPPFVPQAVPGKLLVKKSAAGRKPTPVPSIVLEAQQHQPTQNEFREDVMACVNSYMDLSNLK